MQYKRYWLQGLHKDYDPKRMNSKVYLKTNSVDEALTLQLLLSYETFIWDCDKRIVIDKKHYSMHS